MFLLNLPSSQQPSHGRMDTNQPVVDIVDIDGVVDIGSSSPEIEVRNYLLTGYLAVAYYYIVTGT